MPRWSGETVWGAVAVIRDFLGPAVVGLDPRDIPSVDRRMDAAAKHNWFSKAAIEMACWDVWGRSEGKPVFELLGGAVRPLTMRSRFSLGAYDVPRAQRRTAELIAQGFQTIKVKVGGQPQQDIERVRAVREIIGPERDLYIDANGGWDADTAINCIRAMKELRISLVEQPTPDEDFAGLARVRRETGIITMADDCCFDWQQAKELLRQECCDVISVYPGKNGGIRKSREIVELAGKHGVRCSIGSNLEWDIATAAMGHLVVSTRNMCVEEIPGDILGPMYHAERIVKNPLKIEGPLTTITSGPGLGVEVDWRLVDDLKVV
jgi:muconate cycloisomerase